MRDRHRDLQRINHDLQRVNHDLQRNNTELYNAFQELGREKEALEQETRRQAPRRGLIYELERKVEHERSYRRKVAQKLADERAMWEREAEQRQRRNEETAVREEERVQLIQALQNEKREWRHEKARLTRSLEVRIQRSKDMEVLIEDLEARLASGGGERFR
jgi:hypothetical protein